MGGIPSRRERKKPPVHRRERWQQQSSTTSGSQRQHAEGKQCTTNNLQGKDLTIQSTQNRFLGQSQLSTSSGNLCSNFNSSAQPHIPPEPQSIHDLVQCSRICSVSKSIVHSTTKSIRRPNLDYSSRSPTTTIQSISQKLHLTLWILIAIEY